MKNDTENDDEIQKLVNINEIPESFESNSISSITLERCPKLGPKKKYNNSKTKDNWYQRYSLPDDKFASRDGKNTLSEESSEKMQWQPGQIISAIEAIQYRQDTQNVDIRPKVYDKITQAWTLIDSGSCVSCSPRQEGDVEDQLSN